MNDEQLRLIDVPAVCGVGDEETQRRAMREWLEKNPSRIATTHGAPSARN